MGGPFAAARLVEWAARGRGRSNAEPFDCGLPSGHGTPAVPGRISDCGLNGGRQPGAGGAFNPGNRSPETGKRSKASRRDPRYQSGMRNAEQRTRLRSLARTSPRQARKPAGHGTSRTHAREAGNRKEKQGITARTPVSTRNAELGTGKGEGEGPFDSTAFRSGQAPSHPAEATLES